MKVLQIHSSDFYGGGGGTVAMDRLHTGLRQAGVDSKIVCGRKTTESPHSTAIPRSRPLRRVERSVKKVTKELGLHDIHLFNSFSVKRMDVYKEADILHFHGTHGYFNYLALPTLTKNKPAIFTFHDMWPITGHCTYSYDCERWRNGCGHCPYPQVHPAIKRDNTHIEWKLKKWAYNNAHLSLVALNQWLADKISQSLLSHLPLHQISNGLDIKTYQPLNAAVCRSKLGIPLDKKVLMFMALDLTDRRKGADLLLESLQRLPASLKSNLVLLLMGGGGEALAEAVGLDTVNLGYIRDDKQKAAAYSAADLFVFPTRADNQPLVLQESMACGTPLVSFNVGGVPELVRHGHTGYLAQPEDAEAFKKGIIQLLEDDALRSTLGKQCRAVAVNEYSLDLQVEQHITLYQSAIQNFNHANHSVKSTSGSHVTYPE
ncbi:MAG: glycosyltransferase family 4 protein [Anaerolineae bacterium]|nr:glycosyltransferase family 4 protein [Anaerolineae bacterium]